MADDLEPRRFSPDEVNAILRRVIERQGSSGSSGTISYDELCETARELGLDTSQIDSAIAEQSHIDEVERARKAYIDQRRRKFKEHLRSYLVVNLFLFILDVTLSGGNWFYWVLFGWGIGLYFDAAETFFPKEKDIEKGALRLLEREDRQRRREQLRHHRHGGRGGNVVIDSKRGKIVIEKGDKRIEIG